MSLPLDQLRAQRELVKRHLDWLDSQIAATSATNPAVSVPAAAIPAGAPGAATSDAASAGGDVSAPVSPEVLHADVILEAVAPDEGVSQTAKYGCIAIAAAVVIGFLLILFVLPHFLYPEKKDKAPEDGAVEKVEPAPAVGK